MLSLGHCVFQINTAQPTTVSAARWQAAMQPAGMPLNTPRSDLLQGELHLKATNFLAHRDWLAHCANVGSSRKEDKSMAVASAVVLSVWIPTTASSSP